MVDAKSKTRLESAERHDKTKKKISSIHTRLRGNFCDSLIVAGTFPPFSHAEWRDCDFDVDVRPVVKGLGTHLCLPRSKHRRGDLRQTM